MQPIDFFRRRVASDPDAIALAAPGEPLTLPRNPGRRAVRAMVLGEEDLAL